MERPTDNSVAVSSQNQSQSPVPVPVSSSHLNPLAYVPLPSPQPQPQQPILPPPTASPSLQHAYSPAQSSRDSRSKSPSVPPVGSVSGSAYPESYSSRPTTAATSTIFTGTDATPPTLPPIKSFIGDTPSPFGASALPPASASITPISTSPLPPSAPPSAERITLPPISQMPSAAGGSDGGHYVFGGTTSSSVVSHPSTHPSTHPSQAARFSHLPQPPAPLAFPSTSNANFSTSYAVTGAGAGAYEAPRSPMFNTNTPLAPLPNMAATTPPTSDLPRPPPNNKGKGRATSPQPSINFNAPSGNGAYSFAHDADNLKHDDPLDDDEVPDQGPYGPAPNRSPGFQNVNGNGHVSGSGHTGHGTNYYQALHGNDDVLAANGHRVSVAADPRMSLGNPLPWAHIVSAMTSEQQEAEDMEAAQQAEGSIIVDSDEGNGSSDGGYESDGVSSASTSLAAGVRDYSFENGRRYHKFREGRYNFPNDDVEQEREDMKHAMVKMLCQQLHFAPIGKNPQEILDVGTGTGIWAIEMGDQYSSASVLGIDLSPIQPDWVPPNVRFMVDDAESAWLYPRNHFDYIHSRHTVMAIKDFPRLFRRSLEHLKPGGWLELQELHHSPHSASNSLPDTHPVAQYWSQISSGLRTMGVNLDTPAEHNLANMMRACGFTNVTERVFHVPIGIWPKNKVLKTVGLYWRTILLDGIQAIALGPLTRGCKWTKEQVEVFLVEVRRGYLDNSVHMYMPLHIVYGQKPEGGGGWY